MMESWESQLMTKENIHVIYPSKTECDTQLLSWRKCVETSCTLLRQSSNQTENNLWMLLEIEVNGHVENQNWELIKRSKVPVGKPIQQSVWAMCQKRNLTLGGIVNHKARLNLHGGMQE